MHVHLHLSAEVCADPDKLRAVLAVIAESIPHATTESESPTRPPVREKGPNELEYLRASGDKRMRLGPEFGGMDRESAALVKLAQLGAASQAEGMPPRPAYEPADTTPPDDAGEWEE